MADDPFRRSGGGDPFRGGGGGDPFAAPGRDPFSRGNPAPAQPSRSARPARMESDPRFERLVELTNRGPAQRLNPRSARSFSSRLPGVQNEAERLTRELAEEYSTDYLTVQRSALSNSDMRTFLEQAEQTTDEIMKHPGTKHALSFVGNTAEPVLGAQQLTFRIAKGALDPDTTIAGEVRRMQLGRYFDGNELLPIGLGGRGAQHPDEVVEFGQLMRLGAGRMGIEEEVPQVVYQVGGFLGDVFADPLLAGGLVRGIGRITKSSAAVRLGDALDAPIREAAKGARHAASVAAPGATQRAESAALRWLDGVLSMELPGTRGRRVSLGEYLSPDGRNPLRGSADEGGELTIDPRTGQRQAGREGSVVDAERAGRRTARVTGEALQDRIEGLQKLLGRDRFKGWIQRSFDAIEGRAKAPVESLKALPEDLRDAVSNLVTETVDNRGVLLDPDALANLANVRSQPRAGAVGTSLQDELAAAIDARGAVTPEPTRRQAAGMIRQKAGETLEEAVQRTITEVREVDPAGAGQLLMRTNVERVRHLATQRGVNPDLAERLFRRAVSKTTEADAILGFRASGFEAIRESLYERAVSYGLDAQAAGDVYRRGMAMAMNGVKDLASVDVTDLVEASLRRTGKLKGKATLKDKITFQDAVGDVVAGGQLPLADYFQGLTGGHLRKVYGMLTDDAMQNSIERAFEARELLPSRWITDDVLEGAAERFPEETRELQRYIRQVSPTLSRERGLVLRQEGILKALKARGRNPDQIDEFMTDLLARMNPGMEQFLKHVREFRMQERGATPPPQDLKGTLRRSFTAERTVESGGYMEILTELSGAADVALIEGLENLNKALPANQLLIDLYREASRNPRAMTTNPDLIPGPEHASKLWRKVDDNATLYGPFAGKWVHKYVKRELDNMLADTKYRATRYQQARSLVQAGMITSPRSTTANLAGGFLSAAGLGLNPFRLAVHMSKAAQELWENKGRIADEDAIGDLLTTGLRENDLQLFSRDFARASIGLEQKGFTANLVAGYARLLETPLGRTEGATTAQRVYNAVSGGLGLRGFEFVEDLFKIGAYRLAREKGLGTKEARRFARFAVFDYSAQPELLRWVRDTGVMPFASFPVFAAARTVNALVNRPGVVGAAARLPDALMTALEPNPEVRDALVASMQDWQRDDGWVPMWQDGNDHFGIPMRQLVPTSGFGRSLWDTFESLGVVSGVLDPILALSKNGESTLGARYGKRVFSSDADVPTAIQQTGQFLYNTFAPAITKQVFSFPSNPDTGRFGGIVGALMENVQRVPNLEVNGHSLSEIRRGQVDRGVWSAAVAALVRSPSVVSLDPEVATVMKGYESAQLEAQARQESTMKRYHQALDEGRTDEAARLILEAKMMGLKVHAEWVPRVITWARYLEWARNNGRFPGEREGDTE